MTRPIPFLFPQTSRRLTPDAPPFNAAKPVKSWVDPAPASDPVTYTVLNPDYTFGTLSLSKADAMALNLPGHPDYPTYVNPPSKAVFNGQPLPFGVVAQADAEALAMRMGLSTTAVFDEMDGFKGSISLQYDSSDPRRVFGIRFPNGNSAEAAKLIAMEFANGVGAPGQWKMDANNNPTWVSELPSDTSTNPILPVPLGSMAAGAKVIAVEGGTAQMLEEPDAASAPAPSGSTLNDPRIDEILDGVRKLRALLHV